MTFGARRGLALAMNHSSSSDRPHRSSSGPARRAPAREGGGKFDKRDRPDRDEERKDNPRLSTMAGVEARRTVLEILDRIDEGATLEDAIARTRPYEQLEGPDRGFARALTSETLRRRGAIDHLIGAYLDRPLPKKSARVMDILRIAAAQSLVLETPPHAAVGTAVELAKERRETAGYASLINAITRKISKDGAAALAKLPARVDTPSWMWRAWERAYGPIKTRTIAEAHQRPAQIDLTLKPGEDPSIWATRLDAEVLATGSLRIARVSDIRALDGFEEGAWWVQDTAASLPVKLFGDVAGKVVYDLCAAPGGKTLQLAAVGADVTAVDKSGARLERVNENLVRTGLGAKVVEEDALRFRPTEKADAILLDAPCTATGTIRRHPDIPWSKGETALKALAELQSKMIDHALTMLKPGGTLVYCVCSLQREEGEQQIKAALGRHQSLTRIPVALDEIGGLEAALTRDGDLRTLPFMLAEKGGMDGFFAARLTYSPPEGPAEKSET